LTIFIDISGELMKRNSNLNSVGKLFRNLFVLSIFSILVIACGQAQAAPAQSSVEAEGILAMKSGMGLPKEEAALPENAPQVNEEIPSGAGSADLSAQEDGVGAGLESQALVIEPPTETFVETPAEVPAAEAVPAGESVASDLPVGPQVGYLAPDFGLQTPDGQTIRLSDLRGRPVVVSYWASWCGPCENEMRILQGVYEQYQSTGFTVLAVNAIGQDSMSAVTEMVSRLGLTYPILLDEGDQFADSYQALFFPTTYFVDANGVIRNIALGDSPEAEFQAKVEEFLGIQ
jgi:peroxiredoxin